MRETAQANAFLERLRSGELTLMMAIRSARTTEIVRIAKATGHHAVMVDLEHSAIDVGLAGEMCAAAGDLGLTPFVRVPERDYGIIGRLLDSGASGIVAPRIETVEEAAAICRACCVVWDRHALDRRQRPVRGTRHSRTVFRRRPPETYRQGRGSVQTSQQAIHARRYQRS
jgi:hypothetical protein